MRKIFFWMHLTVGCVAGLVILVMCVTGVLLAYEKQVVNWREARFRVAAPSAGSNVLPVEELLAKVHVFDATAMPTNVSWHAEAAAPMEIVFGREKRLLVNPYNGQILGEGAKSTRGFFMSVENWHRWLAVSTERRAAGRAVTAACNLGFLFLVASGIYMWWPRNWSWAAVKNVVLFNGKLSGRARDFNWHNVIGFWCSVPLLVLVACSVVMSYPWANALVYKATRSPVPLQGGPPNGTAPQNGNGGRGRGGKAVSYDGLGNLFVTAAQKVSGWKTIGLRLPSGSDATATFSIDTGNGRPDLRGQLTLDRKTGEEVKWEPFSSFNAGRRLRTWIRFTHTGEAGGWLGETVAMVAALGGVFLVCTGLMMAWRRLVAWRRRKSGTVAVKELTAERELEAVQQ